MSDPESRQISFLEIYAAVFFSSVPLQMPNTLVKQLEKDADHVLIYVEVPLCPCYQNECFG